MNQGMKKIRSRSLSGPNHEIRKAAVPCFDFDIYVVKSEFELKVFRISTFDIRIFIMQCSLFKILNKLSSLSLAPADACTPLSSTNFLFQ